ncbi:uncharacterized protein LOC118172082 [Oxyura jamaicensis]|uniref:uncharacterized protein LOC118172082 n=1 Tax=Oxyura jamaicensis TaxID=8884 RepID=UPI0015A53350|nr:uncharacterized protein LOC118172082 [Oxyura jamaicensis]
MKTFSSFLQKVITFLTIMSFLGEITGETFFRRQEHENLALQCNQQAAKGKAEIAWYIADSNLQQFKLINCSSKESTFSCGKKGGPSGCSDTLQVAHISPEGGLFACGAVPSDRTPATCPLFHNVSHCKHYNFFLTQTTSSTQVSESESLDSVPETTKSSLVFEDNITLSCEFETTCSGECFALYWIRAAKTSECIFSLANEAGTSRLTYNEHCCIDEDIRGRLLNNTDFSSTDKKSNVTILNATSSDSGEYLCIVTIWTNGKHVWRVANNLSVEVRKDKATYIQWYIASGAIAGIIFLCVVTWLTYLKTAKSKGKNSSTEFTRNYDVVGSPEDECSPYATSCVNDMQRSEHLYCHVTGTYAKVSATDNNMASGTGLEADIHTVYAGE